MIAGILDEFRSANNSESIKALGTQYRIIAARCLCRPKSVVELAPNYRRIKQRIMANKGKKKEASIVSAVNKRARHDYFVEQTFECGLVLEGWEVKAMRAGRAQLTETYVHLKNGEAWLIGAHISPLTTASTHITPNPTRTRKLLLSRLELDRLVGYVERKGYTLVALSMYWIKGRAKLEIGLAKGKKQHDKRATDKDRDWKRQQARILKPR